MQSSDAHKLRINHNQKQPQRIYSTHETIQIYTEWANHYLEKIKYSRQIHDLQADVTDGVVLAQIIEAVTTQRVPEICKKPKTTSQMRDNIESCLVFLSQMGVVLEGISANDVRDGHLKPILSLFFQLSRYKEHQKQRNKDIHNSQRPVSSQQRRYLQHPQTSVVFPGNVKMDMLDRPEKLNAGYTSAFGKAGTNSANNKHVTNNEESSLNLMKLTSESSSRSASPSSAAAGSAVGSGIPHSFIPQPRCLFSMASPPSNLREPITEKYLPMYPSPGTATTLTVMAIPRTKNSQTASQNSNAVLLGSTATSNISRSSPHRTSISSGFSSTRSELSDSSVSLSSDSKIVTKKSLSTISTGVVSRNRCGDRVDRPDKSESSRMNDFTPPTAAGHVVPKGLHKKVINSKQDTEITNSPLRHSRQSASLKNVRKAEDNLHLAYTIGGGDSTNSLSQSNVGNESRTMNINANEDVADITSSANENAATDDSVDNGSKAIPFQHKCGRMRSADIKTWVSSSGIPTPRSLIGTKDKTNLAPPTVPIGAATNQSNINQGPHRNINSDSATCPNSTPPFPNAPNMGNEFPQNVSNGAGIPKPTAAVKGITKQPPNRKEDSLSFSSENEISRMNSVDKLTGSSQVASSNKDESKSTSTDIDNIPFAQEENQLHKRENSQPMKLGVSVPRIAKQVSPGSGFDSSTASGWSSQGSLSKFGGVDFDSSSSSTSLLSPAAADKKEQQSTGGKLLGEENNGNSVIICGSNDDELLPSVKPMEPLERNYEYMTSPQVAPSNWALMRESCETLFMSFENWKKNPKLTDCNPVKMRKRKAVPCPPRSLSKPGSRIYDFADFHNIDMNAAGYMSDGGLLGHEKNRDRLSQLRLSDGYNSDSGVPIHSRRVGESGDRNSAVGSFNLNGMDDQRDDVSKQDRKGHRANNLSFVESFAPSKASSPNVILSKDHQRLSLPTTSEIIVTVGPDSTTRDSQPNLPIKGNNVRDGGCDGGGALPSDYHKSLMINQEQKIGSCVVAQHAMMGTKENHGDGSGRGSGGSFGSPAGLSEGRGKRIGETVRMGSPGGNDNRGSGTGFLRRPGATRNKYVASVTRDKGGTFIEHGDKNMMRAGNCKPTHNTLSFGSVGSAQIKPSISIINQQHGNRSERAPSPKIRTKVKISGGTQTTTDLQEMSGNGREHLASFTQDAKQYRHSQTLPGHAHNQRHPNENNHYASSNSSRNSGSYEQTPSCYKSLSLTTPAATQLSKSLKERILGSQSLPKRANSSADYVAILTAVQQQNQCHHNQHKYGLAYRSRDRMSHHAMGGTLFGGQNRNPKNLDGSGGGGYETYNEIYSSPGVGGGFGNSSYSWLRHSAGYASNISFCPRRLIGGGSMTETESMESLSSTSSVAVQQKDNRSHSLTHGRIPNVQGGEGNMGGEQVNPSRNPLLNRSNSISHFRERTFPRSTKSEKLYPSMMQRAEEGNYYSSTMSATGAAVLPTSPIRGPITRLCSGSSATGLEGPYSSVSAPSSHSVRRCMSPYSGCLAKFSNKDDELNASSLSLVSTASSLYSSQEDKHTHEVIKLKKELAESKEKVRTLTNQLTTNAHVVAAFEQSLSNMTQRLQTLTLTTEQKDSELAELRETVNLLRKQSLATGITTVVHMTGTGACEQSPVERRLSVDSCSSINSISSASSGASHSNASIPPGQIQVTPLGTPVHSGNLNTPESPGSGKKNSRGKGWLRSSFTKAFSRSKSKSRNDSSPENVDLKIPQLESHFRQLMGNEGDGSLYAQQHDNPLITSQSSHGNHRDRLRTHRTIPNPFPPQQESQNSKFQGQSRFSSKTTGTRLPISQVISPPTADKRKKTYGWSHTMGSHSPGSNGGNSAAVEDGKSRQGSTSRQNDDSVVELRKQLREKEMVLTDIRLEALTSAHQLESLKETVTKMRNEMLSLKQENERLQCMVTCKSLTSSQSSLQLSGGTDNVDRRLSSSEVHPPSSTALDMLLTNNVTENEGKCITVSVYLGCHGSYERYIKSVDGLPAQECAIGRIIVNSRTKWDILDTLVKRTFKDYLMRIDSKSCLGLNADSVVCYAVGEVLRTEDKTPPELLPCGYLVGDVTKISVCLRGAVLHELDALAFETLVPKSVLQRLMNLILDHGRIIFCGPSGTGKSYIARKLGEYLVVRSGKDPCQEAIASFSADHKNGNELRQYLSNFVEQCDATAGIDLPHVVILDNLHQVHNLGDVFNGVFLKQKEESPKSVNFSRPIIIGTMTQSADVPPTVVHHNFRWMAFTSQSEPVKGLLRRVLQRKLIEVDTRNGSKNLDLARIVDWVPKAWHHINKFLETHNSGDVTIGPRLFLSCPMDVDNSQSWFADLWHYSLVPYLIEAVKEGLKLYGIKGKWEDPAEYLGLTYPWSMQHSEQLGKSTHLQRIRAEEVGYDEKLGSPVHVGIGEDAKADNNELSGDADPLMNMLLRLKEASNYSGPQKSNEADSNNLTSMSSLNPTDSVATT